MSSRIKIIYPDAQDDEAELHARHFERIQDFADLEICTGRPGSTREHIRRIAPVHGILLGWDLPGLKMNKVNIVIGATSRGGPDYTVC